MLFWHFAHKEADQTWFVLQETWHTTLFDICYCVEVVRFENNSHMLDITCSVAIFWIFMLFWHIVHKVAQNWFVLQETMYTTLFGIY